MSTETFQDLFDRRNQMLHELALWTEMRDHLAKFLDEDAGPTKIGVVSKGAGGVVPQEVIMEAQLQIDGTIDQLQQGISEIERIEVAKHEPTAESTEESTTTESAPGRKKARRRRAEPSTGGAG